MKKDSENVNISENDKKITKQSKSRKNVKAENELEGNKDTNSEKIFKNGEEEDNTVLKEAEPEKEIKPIENIMDTNRLKIREKIREKIVENQLKRNILANRVAEIILSLGFILSFVVIFLMWSNGKYLSEDILGAMLNLSETHESNPLLVIGGAILIMGEKLLSLGNYHAGLIFITLISVVCILKLFGIYQAFKRDKYKGRGVSSQNAADCVIASILLINAIILSGIEATHINSRVDMFIKGITIYDIVLTILLVYGMNIRNNIKRYYKWKVESKREL